ncbi:hypothetical protein KRX51_09820 [Corynebacterium sp. TAE3-ERU12]|uniref:hypothetical protein n=1 Tax=Corynebacterium sp. TAE3-ERU12 TaxID=2849491 RepID=UPI001C46411B|nr:hypothetical protein [Corynebacterium sp. TAE3-ERU12]MBV7296207.1 hypothetical protein [Corynebacterium sp. TAE3-ERU12]
MNNLASVLSCTVGAALASTALVGCSATELEMTALGVAEPTVTVIDAGSGPKSKVRYDDEGSSQSVTVSVTRGFSQSVTGADGEERTDPALPDTTMELPLQASVTGGGADRAVSVTLEEPHGSDTSLNDDLATAEGFQAAWESTNAGQRTAVEVGAPEDATATARAGVEASLRQWLSTPVAFPEEPIGAGATWTVSTTISDEVDTEQVVTYSLVSREGEQVELSAKVELTPVVRTIEGNGVELEILDVGTKTEQGRLVVDLGEPIPVSGELSYVTTVVYGETGADDTKDDPAGTRITQRTLRGLSFIAD